MLTRGQKARRSQQQLDAIQSLSGHVLELGPVATLLVLRQLWLLKRVNRYMYSEGLMTRPSGAAQVDAKAEPGVSHHIVIVFITHPHSRACLRQSPQ